MSLSLSGKILAGILAALFLVIALSSCSNQNIIDIKGSRPITREEADLWSAKALRAHNIIVAKTDSLPPLDYPDFNDCLKFLRRQQPNMDQGWLKQSCKMQYEQLIVSSLNTLIVSRWASSSDNPLRSKPVSYNDASKITKIELNMSFPDSAEQKQFLKESDLTYKDLVQRRQMDLSILKFIEQSKGNIPQPSVEQLDQIISQNKNLVKLPKETARARAGRIWISEQKQKADYSIDQIRAATTCQDKVVSAYCGNRPSPGAGSSEATIFAAPLILFGSGYNQGNFERIARAEGLTGRTRPRNLGAESPLPYSSFDASSSIKVKRSDTSK